jgi:hypothetical protein
MAFLYKHLTLDMQTTPIHLSTFCMLTEASGVGGHGSCTLKHAVRRDDGALNLEYGIPSTFYSSLWAVATILKQHAKCTLFCQCLLCLKKNIGLSEQKQYLICLGISCA